MQMLSTGLCVHQKVCELTLINGMYKDIFPCIYSVTLTLVLHNLQYLAFLQIPIGFCFLCSKPVYSILQHRKEYWFTVEQPLVLIECRDRNFKSGFPDLKIDQSFLSLSLSTQDEVCFCIWLEATLTKGSIIPFHFFVPPTCPPQRGMVWETDI